jgi:hypothetical protein
MPNLSANAPTQDGSERLRASLRWLTRQAKRAHADDAPRRPPTNHPNPDWNTPDD